MFSAGFINNFLHLLTHSGMSEINVAQLPT